MTQEVKEQTIELIDGDYTLKEGSGWFDVKGFAIRINSTGEGVVVDIFDSKALALSGGIGDEALLASTYAFDSDLASAEAES